MTQQVERFLHLLGPTLIKQIYKDQRKSGCDPEDEIPHFRSQKTIALLGYLATERRPKSRAYLAALFWPDEAISNGRRNLSRELYNLSRLLPDSWVVDRKVVAFVPSPYTSVDIDIFGELEAEERWGEASELVRGEFLEGIYLHNNINFENWLLGERERWRDRIEAVLWHVIRGHKRRGHYAEAIHIARRLQQLTPWNEGVHQQLMSLLSWTGQRGGALRQYEICKQTLLDELDIMPSEETISLYRQIKTGNLEPPPQPPAFLTDEKARHKFVRSPFVGRKSQIAQLDGFIKAALAGWGRVIFITGGPGRGKTALLDAFTLRTLEAYPDLLILMGKNYAYRGVGDPYFPFRDIIAMLTGDVEARWDAGAISREHARRLWDAFPLVIQALLDYGPHLVDVLVPGSTLLSRAIIAGTPDDIWFPRLRALVNRQQTDYQDVKQDYLFQQVTDMLLSLARERPLLIVLDDLQWADDASISLLFYLGRRLAEKGGRLLIACAYRPEEIAFGRISTSSGQADRHPLAQILSEFKRTFGDVWVNLGQSDEEEDRKFVDELVNIEPNRLEEKFKDTLFNHTKGHPLFTLELLRSMQERGDVFKDKEGFWLEGPKLDWGALPARVEAVIEERINRLSLELQEILNIASVEGEIFTAQVLAEVQHIPELLCLRKLSCELEQRHRLVREIDEVNTGTGRVSRYRFGHALYKDYVYKRLHIGERRLLHREVGLSIEKLYEGQSDEMAVQLAHHFDIANDHDRALHYFAMAGSRAVRLYENREAITHYTRAIQLAEQVNLDNDPLFGFYRGRGMAYRSLGNFEEARADHEMCLQIAKSEKKPKLAWRATLDLGKLWASRDYQQAHVCFENALKFASRINDPAFQAESLNWMGNWYLNAENPRKAAENHLEALEIVEGLCNQRELANTLDLLGMTHLLGGDFSASVRYYDEAIALFRELGDRSRLISSLTGRAANISMLIFLTSAAADPSPDVMADINEALKISREIKSPSDETWAYWTMGLIYTVRGNFRTAQQYLQSGLRIACDIGHREYEVGNRFALGILNTEIFNLDQARKQLEKALTLTRDLRSSTMVHLTSGSLIKVYFLSGDLKSAENYLKEIISPRTPMDTLGKRYCWVRRAELALLQEDPALALEIIEGLIASAPGKKPGQVITFLWWLKGKAMAALGELEMALSLFLEALHNAQETGERFLLWQIHASLSHLYSALGQEKAAKVELSEAEMLVDEFAETVSDKKLMESFL